MTEGLVRSSRNLSVWEKKKTSLSGGSSVALQKSLYCWYFDAVVDNVSGQLLPWTVLLWATALRFSAGISEIEERLRDSGAAKYSAAMLANSWFLPCSLNVLFFLMTGEVCITYERVPLMSKRRLSECA